jgi:hypothetical protein
MITVTYMVGATALTAFAQLSKADQFTRIGRTIVGGVLATAGVLTLGMWSSEVARGLAALVFVTSALVNGATIASIVNKSIGAS